VEEKVARDSGEASEHQYLFFAQVREEHERQKFQIRMPLHEILKNSEDEMKIKN
jgi:hypothetical protein